MRLHDFKWRFQRLFEHTNKDGSEFFRWFGYNLLQIAKIPYDFFRDFIQYLKNVKAYSHLLWSDRDYDWSPILAFLQFKIKRTADHIEKHQLHRDWKKDVKNMREAVRLIDICMDDMHYHDEVFKDVEAKWGRHIWYREDDLFNKKNNLNYTTTMTRYEKENDSNREQVRKDVRAAFNREHKLWQKDWDKLWKLLNENLRSWWD